MPTLNFSADILNAAIYGLEQKKVQIDSQIGELRALLTGHAPEADVLPKKDGRRKKRSAESIRRMSEGQQRRWANKASAEKPEPKRKMSAAGRAAIVAALKKRWAAKKAESQSAVSKKTAKS